MSFLDSVKQGHVLSGNGMYELPSAEEVLTKIKKNLLPHQEKFCADTEHRKLALVCCFVALLVSCFVGLLARCFAGFLVVGCLAQESKARGRVARRAVRYICRPPVRESMAC